MTDALRYLMIVTGVAVWTAWVVFLVLGSIAYARQAREQRRAEAAEWDADLAAQRDEGMGDVWHYRHECEVTPVFDEVVRWEQRR